VMELTTQIQDDYNESVTATERPIRGNAAAVQELTDKLRAQQEHQDIVNAITQDTDRIIAQYGLGINSTSRELEEMAYASGELEGAEDRLKENIAATNERMEAQDEQAKALREAHELAAKAAAEHAAMQGDLFAEALRNSGEETESLAMQLYGAADAAGAGAEELAFLALATGEFTEEQVQAALEAAIMKEQIQLLAEQVADGSITVQQATDALGLMQDGMAANVSEAQTLIGKMENMSVAMSELDGKTVSLNFSAPGLSGIVQQMSALQGGAGGVVKTTNVNGNTQVAGALATGGPVSAGNAYLVGEQGPEVVVMGGNGTVVPNHELGGNTINITVNGGGGNGRRLGQQIAAEVNNALGRLN
jgi:chromosome segregation ATPase